MEADHFVPQVAGGQHNTENPRLLCVHCNRVKGDRQLAHRGATAIKFVLLTGTPIDRF